MISSATSHSPTHPSSFSLAPSGAAFSPRSHTQQLSSASETECNELGRGNAKVGVAAVAWQAKSVRETKPARASFATVSLDSDESLD